MEHSVKIAVVGAGSLTFSADLVRDMVLSEVLAGSTLSLMDIDRRRLDDVTELLGRYVKEVHGDLNVESTERLEKALEGADFVINTGWPAGTLRRRRNGRSPRLMAIIEVFAWCTCSGTCS